MKWYEISNINEIDTPALIVFPDRIAANITAALSMVKDVSKLRPHIKTHKSKEAARMMLDAGITKFKCATIAEGELLGSLNAPDVLLAYPVVGPKVKRFIQLMVRFPSTRFSCLVDDIKVAENLNREATSNEVKIEVFLDIDLGMHRTGIASGSGAMELANYCIETTGLTLRGLHGYDGHIRDIDLLERKKNSDEALAPVFNLIKSFNHPLTLICGGSPTFPIHAQREDVECSPGTFIYWDQGYSDIYQGTSFLPAAVLATRVISKPYAFITCDLGHKSVAAEQDIRHRIHFLNANDLEPISQSEEHLVIQAPPDLPIHIGDVLYGIPHHICPTVALYEKVYTAYDHRVTGEWRNVARDRRITI